MCHFLLLLLLFFKCNLVTCIAAACGSRVHTEMLVSSSNVCFFLSCNIYTRPSSLFCVHIPDHQTDTLPPDRLASAEDVSSCPAWKPLLTKGGMPTDGRTHRQTDGWAGRQAGMRHISRSTTKYEGRWGGGVSDTGGERPFTCLIINAAPASAIVVRDMHTKRSTWVHLGRIKAFNNGEGRLGRDAVSLDTA